MPPRAPAATRNIHLEVGADDAHAVLVQVDLPRDISHHEAMAAHQAVDPLTTREVQGARAADMIIGPNAGHTTSQKVPQENGSVPISSSAKGRREMSAKVTKMQATKPRSAATGGRGHQLARLSLYE